MARKQPVVKEEPVVDLTGWMLDNSIAEFILMHTIEIKFMCMVGYCFLGGVKVFSASPPKSSAAYKFINLIFTCTGGGILVPLFLNGLPVPLSNDYYVMAILISYAIHYYFPIIREVYKISPIFQTLIIVMFETNRTFVVTNFVNVAAKTIPPTAFGFPVFGPVMCGAVAGCGGAFLPFNKGLDPLFNGVNPPMLTAFIASAFYHIYLSTSLSEGCIGAKDKARCFVAYFFIAVALINSFGLVKKPEPVKTKVN